MYVCFGCGGEQCFIYGVGVVVGGVVRVVV